jgi:hypothetical protein
VSQKIPARSAVEFVRKECVDRRVQLEKDFVLISSKVQIGTVSCKECAGQVKSQSCDSEQSIERLLLQECAESKDFNT